MSLWEKGLILITMLLTLAITDAPSLAQWIQHRSIKDISVDTPAVLADQHN